MTSSALIWSLLPVLSLLALQSPSAPPPTAPAGHWEGTIQAPGQELAIEVDLAPDAGGVWVGQITIPAQNLKAFPLTGLTVDASAVTFGMKAIPGDPLFKGTVAKDAKTISGTLSQSGLAMPFALTVKGPARLEPAPKNKPVTKDLEGSWEGSLNAGGTVLRLVLKLSNVDGAATGTLTSLDQGGADIPLATITQASSHLTVVVSAIGGTFEGEMKDGQVAGTWAQGQATLPLVFTRQQK